MRRLFLFCIFLVSLVQTYSQEATVNSNVNFRAESNPLAKRITIIPKGSAVIITDSTNGWYQAIYSGITGFININYVHFNQDHDLKSSVNEDEYNNSNLHQNNTNSSVRFYRNIDGETAQSPTRYETVPIGATAVCRDGTYSFSRHRRGTCSHHGGVARWLE